MRHNEIVFTDDPLVVQKKVDVDRPRSRDRAAVVWPRQSVLNPSRGPQ
jgi:hypothetical protein